MAHVNRVLSMVSSILSLLIGALTLSLSTALLYVTWLSGETPQFLALSSVCSLGFAALSGWLTALVSQRAPLAHALALALLLTMSWGLYTLTGNDPQPPLSWSLLNGAIGAIGVIAGGWIRSNQMKGRDRTTLKAETQPIKP